MVVAEEFDLTLNQVMAIALCGVVVLIALYLLAAWVRRWGKQMPKSDPLGGLDLAELKRQREQGLITPEEFETISRGLAGKPKALASPPGQSIKKSGAGEGAPPANEEGPPGQPPGSEGSRKNGEG
jgi:hypothetical protein